MMEEVLTDSESSFSGMVVGACLMLGDNGLDPVVPSDRLELRTVAGGFDIAGSDSLAALESFLVVGVAAGGVGMSC